MTRVLHKMENGILLEADTSQPDKMIIDEIWKLNRYQILFPQRQLPPPILDIGAYKGYFSVMCASRGAKVIAYEPNFDSFRAMIHNVHTNNIPMDGEGSVRAFNDGVWKEDAELHLHTHPTSHGCDTLINGDICRGGCGYPGPMVPCVAFDDVIGDTHWAFVKMDCEGAEYEILLNASEKSLSQIDQIAIELHGPERLKEMYSIAAIAADEVNFSKLKGMRSLARSRLSHSPSRLEISLRDSPMITVELAGGLGNQMFQYACGRALSLRLGTDLQLNTTNPDRDPLRRYALGCFPNITAPLTKRLPGRIIEEKRPGYQPELLAGIGRGEDVTLRGYWQTEKYFANLAEIIRKDFDFKGSIALKANMESLNIRAKNAVSIHVRRTDYLAPESLRIMGSCSAEYYLEAQRQITCRVVNPSYFLFTDDPTWCKANFGRLNLHQDIFVVEGNKDFDDLWLMSLCQSSIMANSSFSWWGAWLRNPRGITIAPKKWFAQWNSADVCPPSWLRI